MSTTVQAVLTGAYAHSAKNNPSKIATDATELLQVVIRATRGLYSFAARVNPFFFAVKTNVVGVAGVWARPVAAESLFRIEDDSDDEVAVVPLDDKLAEPSMPAVYEFGQNFYTAGAVIDPDATDTLTFFYSKRPDSPADITANIDATWPEQFNELLMLEVAIYLALKDGRTEELSTLTAARDKEVQLYVAFLEHATVNVRRRWGSVQRFNTPTLVPLMSILAGPAKLAA